MIVSVHRGDIIFADIHMAYLQTQSWVQVIPTKSRFSFFVPNSYHLLDEKINEDPVCQNAGIVYKKF